MNPRVDEDAVVSYIPAASRVEISLLGMEKVLRAATVAMAGAHRLHVIGIPGSGKTEIDKLIGTIARIHVRSSLPCPCGMSMAKNSPCRCSVEVIQEYKARLFLETYHYEIHIRTPNSADHIFEEPSNFTVNDIRDSLSRYSSATEVTSDPRMWDSECQQLFRRKINELSIAQFSVARNVGRVAATIARLDNKTNMRLECISEAFQYAPSLF